MIRHAAGLAAVLVAVAAGHASAAPRAVVGGRVAGLRFKPVCADFSCKSFVAIDADGKIHADLAPPGSALGADDLESAYHVDPALGDGQTVAIVEGTGYADIESDLAVYRDRYGLPPCTIASGCLTVVNDNGDTSPLPADSPGTIVEAALDMDMVSAGCPRCKILVVEGGALGGNSTQLGQIVAARLHANAIADSYGGPEDGTELTTREGDYNNPGTGTFVSTGDYGNNMVFFNLAGPSYPATSAHVIAVGGTRLAPVDVAVNPRGWVEGAWSDAGSSCSTSIPKPSYQPASAVCGMRATSDVSAMADPNPGLAVYIAAQGGWTRVGGTSASAPLTAAIFAGAGHSDAVPAFVYKHPDAFLDITLGQNGSCGTNMCNAGTGWDGPTGLGSIDQTKLLAIGNIAGGGPDAQITFPADGVTLPPGFTIEATTGSDTAYLEFSVDGVIVGYENIAPYQVSAPLTLASGPHTLAVTAYDVDHNSKQTMIDVTQSEAKAAGDNSSCSAGGASGGAGVLFVLGGVLARRRRAA